MIAAAVTNIKSVAINRYNPEALDSIASQFTPGPQQSETPSP